MSTDQHFGNIKHRNGLSKCFITFPQSGGVCSKDELLQFMNSSFSVLKYMIVEEPHEGLGVHLHGIFTFSKKPSKAQILNACKTKFPKDFKRIDIQSVKSEKAATQYLIDPVKNKHTDPEPLTNYEINNDECQSVNKSLKAYMFENIEDDQQIMHKEFALSHFLNYECQKCKVYLQKFAAELSQIDLDSIEIT